MTARSTASARENLDDESPPGSRRPMPSHALLYRIASTKTVCLGNATSTLAQFEHFFKFNNMPRLFDKLMFIKRHTRL